MPGKLKCDWVIWLLDRQFVGYGNEARCRTCGAVKTDQCTNGASWNDVDVSLEAYEKRLMDEILASIK